MYKRKRGCVQVSQDADRVCSVLVCDANQYRCLSCKHVMLERSVAFVEVSEEAVWVCSMHPLASMRSCAEPEDTTIIHRFAGMCPNLPIWTCKSVLTLL